MKLFLPALVVSTWMHGAVPAPRPQAQPNTLPLAAESHRLPLAFERAIQSAA